MVDVKTKEELAKKVIDVVEEQIDAEIEKLDRIKGEEFETLRQRRLESLRKEDKKKREWLRLGHGEYDEIDERLFFNVTKTSNVIVHFFLTSTQRCQIVDMHFKDLAKRHIEARFLKMNAEKCPFVTENLRISVIPTLIIIKNNVLVDKIVGFTELGNCDDFSTEMLEWRLAKSEVIDYDGDITCPPQKLKVNQKIKIIDKKSIRCNNEDSSEDD